MSTTRRPSSEQLHHAVVCAHRQIVATVRAHDRTDGATPWNGTYTDGAVRQRLHGRDLAPERLPRQPAQKLSVRPRSACGRTRPDPMGFRSLRVIGARRYPAGGPARSPQLSYSYLSGRPQTTNRERVASEVRRAAARARTAAHTARRSRTGAVSRGRAQQTRRRHGVRDLPGRLDGQGNDRQEPLAPRVACLATAPIRMRSPDEYLGQGAVGARGTASNVASPVATSRFAVQAGVAP